MNAWLETAGVAALAAAGVLLGRWFGRLPKPYWLIGYAAPMVLVVLIGIGYRSRTLEFVAPFSWLMGGRTEYVLAGVVGALTLTTPLSRLPLRRDRIFVTALMAALVVYVSLLPFALPAALEGRFARLPTTIDGAGVCRQSNDYLCGPAAAVTALRKMGLCADEGELAILAHATPISGTQPDSLCAALNRRFAGEGLVCEFRPFDSVTALRESDAAVALVRFNWLTDHYVAVLDVTDDAVVVGDPLLGKETLSQDEFARCWRFVAVTLNRTHR